jgi:hypothetical protein
MDDEMGKGPCGPKRGGEWVTHGGRRKVALEGDMMGEGPTQAKHRAAEHDGIARAPLIRAL